MSVLKYCMLQLAALIVLAMLCLQLRDTYLLKSAYKDRVYDLTRHIERLRADIHYARHQEVRLNNNFSIWQELYNNRVYLNDEQAEGESIESMIGRLSVVHKVRADSIVASEPVDVSDSYRKQYIRVENSKVTIRFSALTDKHAVLFMQAIRYDIPGFVSIRRFEVAKKRELTEEVIREHTEGRVLHTVSGTIMFELYKITGHHI